MSASVSPHGFETVRGRGYRPDDVDRRVEGLSIDRDSCWERAARLTVLANKMAGELAELKAHVAQLPPQTYASLGEQAQVILTTAEAEAARLRAEAEAAAEEVGDEAEAYARRIRAAADKEAKALRAGAQEQARRIEEEAWAEAHAEAAAAQQDAERWRSEAAAELKETVHRTEQIWQDQERRQSEEWDALGRELALMEEELEQRVAELEVLGETRMAEGRRLQAEIEEAARHTQEEAQDHAAELLAQARVKAERIERTTERILREHEEECAEVRAHMTHVRNSLAALTGKDPEAEEAEGEAEGNDAGAGAGEDAGGAVVEEPPQAGPPPEAGPEAGPEPGPVSAPAVDTRAPVDPDEEDTLETELPRLDAETTEQLPRLDG